LFQEEPPGGVGDYDVGSDAAEEGRRDWIESLKAMSKE